jgi:hypothetical protein
MRPLRCTSASPECARIAATTPAPSDAPKASRKYASAGCASGHGRDMRPAGGNGSGTESVRPPLAAAPHAPPRSRCSGAHGHGVV